MKDVRDNVFSFLDDWYGRLDDIIEDLKNNGFAVLNATNEFIDVSDENDKEYVLKLGGTEKTITINKIESLNESLIPITEGGIYPVDLDNGADEAFIKVVNEILGGNVSEVDNLELIPALGFGGGGRYWYRAKIILDEETIVNFITDESTPEAKNLLDSGDLIINPYSDISIDCSANKKEYVDGTTLDALNDSDANMEKLDNESIIIGEAIIAKLFESEDKIIKVLKEYEYSDDDDYIDESLIPIQEYYDEDEWDDDELASIYGGDTKDSQKAIADEMNESTLNEASNPRADLEFKINKLAVSLNRNGNYELSRYNKNKLRELALAIINYRNNYDSKAYQIYIDMINRKAKSWSTPTYDEYRTKYANKLGMNESVYDGDTANWNKISIGDVARWTTKGMGRLPKVGDSFRVGPFIGKCTKISGSKVYMKVESNARESDVNESSGHPKLGKKIKQLKGWKIYQGTDQFGETVFRCFTPDDDYPTVGYEDWECETLDQAISWIENYDLKESKKPVNESNKELARIAFEDILKPFNGTDIKYTDETEDAEFKTHSYVANIISTPQYVELIKKLIDSDKYEYDPDFNDYVKYTEYGQITIIIEDKYITIEVMYNNDEDYFDENLILIKEKNNDEKVIYKDNINIDMNVVITEDPNNSEYYNIYVDDDPTLFLQEPKSAVKKLKLTALDAVIDYYKAEHFSDTDY